MKYMMLIYSAEGAWGPGERDQCMTDSTKLCEQLAANGQFVGASPLQSVAVATSVRVRNGKRLVTDGPFAETQEQLGGYYIIEANHLDVAIDIAGQIPAARKGTVEIRPLELLAGLPPKS